MTTKPANLFPALRGRMADWWYYITTMTFADVAHLVKRADKIRERKELKTWIQREIKEERLKQIADYLQSQKQHFFNAIVVGIYHGEPQWLPVEVGENPTHPELVPGDRERTAFGLLHLAGDEEMFAIDGQHRVEGIKEALKLDGKLANEELCVIFVGHREDDNGHRRTRRLFFTLNRYAKPVSESDLIALSEDDAFAIATRRLVDDYPGLDEKRVIKASGANLPTGDTSSLTTLVALYRSVVVLARPAKAKERNRFKQGPLKSEDADLVFAVATKFWDTLKKKVTPIQEICSAREPAVVTPKYRKNDGGHLLYRPLGLSCFSQATRVLMDRGNSVDQAVARLAKVQLDLDKDPWVNVLWNPHTKRMAETKNAKLASNLFLRFVGEKPHPKGFNTLKKYREVIGQPKARLPRPSGKPH